YWILLDGTSGWIRLDLPGESRLNRVSLLNTRNGLGFDRRTRAYRVELIGPGGSSSFPGDLPAYPRWGQLDLPGTPVTAVVVHIDGHDGRGGGLDEISLEGHPAHGLGAHRETIWALVLTAALVLLGLRAPARLRAAATPQRLCFVVLGVVLVAIGYRLLRFSTSVSVFDWDLTYKAGDFDTWAKTRAFFANLRIPLPPVLAFLEIGAFRATGSSELVIRTLYKASIVGGYLG